MELRPTVERFLRPAVFAGAGLLAVAGCAGDEPGGPATETTPSQETTVAAGGGESYRVVEVVDGDTVKIEMNGIVEDVRIMGIDTPETRHPNKPVQCYGREATEHARLLLEGETVQAVRDTDGDTRDVHDRLLFYLRIPDVKPEAYGENAGLFTEDPDNEPDDFGEQMTRDGFAFEYTHEGRDYDMQRQYQEAESEAEREERGLWSPDTCDGEHKPVEEEGAASSASDADACEPDQIKGNINAEREKIYHEPGGQYYDRTKIDESKGERCFDTPEEAEAAGWHPAG